MARSDTPWEDYEELDVRLDRDVLRIALDRPDSLNVVNGPLHEELSRVFKDAYRSDARVIVLTGNGDAFSAGGDIGWMQDSIEQEGAFLETIREGEAIIRDMIDLEKPIIARVNGDAVGLGATLALFCDIVVASEDARIGDPHVKVGLVAGDGGAVIWPLLTNMHKAKELLMTGDLLSAEEALELGLINYAVPPEELDGKVEELVEKLATGSQVAIRYTKKAVNQWLKLGVDLILQDSIALEGLSQKHPDHEEGVDAFLNRRSPEFPTARSPGADDEDGETDR